MEKIHLFAQPWWVNLLIIVSCAAFLLWRKKGLNLTWGLLLAISAFALAFGFVEAAVVVYLRAAIGLLPGYDVGTLADVRRLSMAYQQLQSLHHFPKSLLAIEIMREAATMIMLVCIAALAASGMRERCASFLWAFAIWDIVYYAGLWATVGWPSSLKQLDVLFLIPTPWIAPVWYPLLVSTLTLLAVASTKRRMIV